MFAGKNLIPCELPVLSGDAQNTKGRVAQSTRPLIVFLRKAALLATLPANSGKVATQGDLHTQPALPSLDRVGAALQHRFMAMRRLAAKALSEESRATPRLSFYQNITPF